METLHQKIHDLNKLIMKGHALKGFEKHYHDQVTMQENESTPTAGKQTKKTN